jgi:hypothetical protein
VGAVAGALVYSQGADRPRANIAKGSEIAYMRVPSTQDDGHCELCWTNHLPSIWPRCRREGYATLDHKHWFCPDCLDEIKDHYALKIVELPGQPTPPT